MILVSDLEDVETQIVIKIQTERPKIEKKDLTLRKTRFNIEKEHLQVAKDQLQVDHYKGEINKGY